MRSFRSEINGLRALAVLVVMLFHAGVPGLRGGFLGVDVFFVISGFLMTQIILDGLARDRFSLVGFWAARVRRIVPALAVLCAALALFGWWLIDPLTYLDLGRETGAALLFWSNVLFWRDSGYFDTASEAKWLLHTWSLAVEWQFYLVYPLVLVPIHRLLGQRAVAPLLWAGCTASLVLSGIVTAWRPALAFYMLPTRAWEMMAGGLVLVHGPILARLRPPSRRVLEWVGLGILAVSLVLVRPQTPWPSVWALLPVVGTVAVIAADRGQASLLRTGAAQRLGLWSYSVYLWHWPVIVAFRYFGFDVAPWAAPAEVALGVMLGAASYMLVEQPSRRWLEQAPTARVLAATIASVAALVVWSAADAQTGGFLARARDPTLMADYLAARSDWVFPEEACGRTGADRSIHLCRIGRGDGTLVIGDSHANQWFARALDRGGDATFLTRDGCAPLPGVAVSGVDCADFYRTALAAAKVGPYRRIVFAAFWPSYLRPGAFAQGSCVMEGKACIAPDTHPEAVATVFETFAQDLRALGPDKQVVLVLPDLEPPGDLPVELAKAAFFGRDSARLSTAPLAEVRAGTEATRQALLRVAAAVHAETVDPLTTLCEPDTCRFVDAAGRPRFRDSNHLRSSVVRSGLPVLDPYIGRPATLADAEHAEPVLRPTLP